MPVFDSLRSLYSKARRLRARRFSCTFAFLLLAASTTLCPAASIRGVVTDTSGTKVTGANVVLICNGSVVASAISTADGSFQILTGVEGRFFLVVSSKSLRQLETPDFYAGRLDSIERTLVVEPPWVRASIVSAPTGTPTPQPETSGATSVLAPLDLALRSDLVSALRLMPGNFVVQNGQLGAQTSLLIRGGDADANKFLLDGVSVGGVGNHFDLGPLSTTAIERAEVYSGPDSSLFGAGAGSGVVILRTPHGTTSFPSILFQGDAGNFSTSREEVEVAGAHNRLDYLGAFSWMQSANDLPLDKYHVATSAANLGWQLSGNTQLRATLRYGVDATGLPGPWEFYRLSADRKQGDQNLYAGLTAENQTTPDFHNRFQYGLVRKREQIRQWTPEGVSGADGNFYGQLVNIQGANGYSATGQALLDYVANGGVYPRRADLISERDQFLYQGDYHLTPHLLLLAGFHMENERGAGREAAYSIDRTVNWTNYDVLFGAQGDFFRRRLFYVLGGNVEHYQLIGNGISPHVGLGFYALRARHGVFSGTRLNFSFSEGVGEPTLTEEFGSLYSFLKQNGGQTTIQQMHVAPLDAPSARTWEGGVEQSFWSERIIFRITYFHNEFGREMETLNAGLIPALLPSLPLTQRASVAAFFNNNDVYSLAVNSLAFRAQGIETTVESGIGKNLFLRGGYTYLDTVVQHSFVSDNLSGYIPSFDGIPVGVDAPLKGARPFQRPPHTGFFTASFTSGFFTGIFTSAFASRSDDSTFLGWKDAAQGNSLVLPNRNLDSGYAKLDLGASLRLMQWLRIYGQAENLTGNQHIAPVGYLSLPFNLRAGLRVEWGGAKSR
jgi:iron complex outermembrane receptor protein/vitamin B12 transporter